MSTFSVNYRLIFRICALIAVIVFAYFFPSIILYLFLALLLSLLGKPVARAIHKVKIFKRAIPYWLCSLITIVFFLVIAGLLMLLFIPAVVQEIQLIGNINYDAVATYANDLLDRIQNFLYQNDLMDSQQTIMGLATVELQKLLNMDVITRFVSGAVSSTGSFLMGCFTVFFMAFFFIKDDFQIMKVVRLFINPEYTQRAELVSGKINTMLTRYCAGSAIRILIMIVLIYIGLALFKVKGALFLAILGGVLNIIPYLGPVIGAVIGCLFGFIDCVSVEAYTEILPVMLKVVATFVGANVIDNTVLQAYIFSQSVHIHPVEVLLITIIAGNIAGMMGMIFAIPVYTIIRIIIKEIYQYVFQEHTKQDLVNN